MKRLLCLILAGSFLLSSIGCGNVFVRGMGSVLNGTGGTVQVTFVTFIENGTFSTVGFCADQTSLFPLDQTVLVNFNPGQPCATVIIVVIVG